MVCCGVHRRPWVHAVPRRGEPAANAASASAIARASRRRRDIPTESSLDSTTFARIITRRRSSGVEETPCDALSVHRLRRAHLRGIPRQSKCDRW